MAGPSMLSIGAGSNGARGSIEAPAGDEYLPRGFGADTQDEFKAIAATPRGTKVVGSLEHPILPMPPVRIYYLIRITSVHILSHSARL